MNTKSEHKSESLTEIEKLKIIEENLKVGLPENGTWDVEVLIPFEDAHDKKLPQVLRLIKNKISQKYNLPVGLLNYHNLKTKEVESGGIRITTLIQQDMPEKGEPVVRFISAKTSQGIEYDDMALYLDLYPIKEDGEALSMSDIELLLSKAVIEMNQVDKTEIEKGLKTVQTEMLPVRNIPLAKGRLPDPSIDAEVEINFEFNEIEQDRYISTGKVDADQVLLIKTPPKMGALSGYNVRGTEIRPPKPKDILLMAKDNAILNEERDKIKSKIPGIVKMVESDLADANYTSQIRVSVEPVSSIPGSKVLDIATDDNIEILGDVHSGSKIVARGEILISGDIERGSEIVSTGNINVKGKIDNSTLKSGGNIEGEGEIKSSTLIAKNCINFRGDVSDSEISGYEVRLDKISGCTINAGSMVTVNTVSQDEKGFTALITIGLIKYIQELIKSNEEIILYSKNNLDRCEEAVGKEIVQTANPTNGTRLLIKFCRQLRREGVMLISREQNEAIRELIVIIGPLRELMKEKVELNKELRLEVKKRKEEKPKFILQEGVESEVELELAGVKTKVVPDDRAMMIQKSGAKIIRKALDKIIKIYPDLAE